MQSQHLSRLTQGGGDRRPGPRAVRPLKRADLEAEPARMASITASRTLAILSRADIQTTWCGSRSIGKIEVSGVQTQLVEHVQAGTADAADPQRPISASSSMRSPRATLTETSLFAGQLLDPRAIRSTLVCGVEGTAQDQNIADGKQSLERWVIIDISFQLGLEATAVVVVDVHVESGRAVRSCAQCAPSQDADAPPRSARCL